MTTTTEELEALRAALELAQSQVASLAIEVESLSTENVRLRKNYEVLALEYERTLRGLKTPSRERVPASDVQLSLFEVLQALGVMKQDIGDDADAPAASEPEEPKKKPRNQRKGSRRNLRLEDMPSVPIVIEPPDKADGWIRIGQEVASHLEYRPGSLVRVDVIRPKYKRPDETITIAEVPERPFEKSAAGPGLMAHVLVSKYADHLPLHRQAKIFKRQGLPLAKQTLQDWTFASTSALRRIVDAMWDDARDNAAWVAMDSTGVLVREREQCRRTHFYVVIAENRHVLFRALPKNDGESVAEMAKGFSGYCLCDALSVYHQLFENEQLLESGCWAHARRKFFDALSTDREMALVGIGLINRLFDIQRDTYDPAAKRADTEARRDAARPVLRSILKWIRENRDALPADAPVRKAMNYVINQLKPLCRFLRDGRLRIDNNISELQLRRTVVGRKNWLFFGADSGAEANTIATTIIASCQMHGIEPWAYLREVLWLLPGWDQTRVLELAPANWAVTRENAEERLAALTLAQIPFD